jgi:tetratricopeptide (TPR) repeat protein
MVSLGIAALLFGCGGAEERKAEHLAKGKSFFEAHNVDKAAIEFRNVLQIDPKTAKPYYYLGLIEEQKKNWPQAFGMFQKSVELNPNDLDARFKLAQFYSLARDADKATEMLGPVIAAKPGDIDARMLRAAISHLKGDSAAAFAELNAIIAEKPGRPEPYMALASLYSQRSRPADAEKALKEGLAVEPKSALFLGGLAKLYEHQKRWAEAEAAERDLIEADPKQLRYRAMLAETYLKQGRFDEVEKTLRAAVKDFPDTPQPATMLAEFLFKRNEPAQAESELRAAIAANPKPAELHVALAALLEKGRKFGDAEKVFRDFIGANEDQPDAVKVKVLLAEMLARQGKAGESEALVKAVLAKNPQDHAALLLMGRLALGKKNAQDAISAFRSVLKDQPDSTEVMALLATAFQLDGKPALVQENLEHAVRLKPQDFSLRRNLAQFLIQQGKLPEALAQADDFLKVQPDSLEGLNLKADVLVLSKNNEAVEAALKDMKARFPDKPVGAFRLGSFYQNQQKYDAALAEYEIAMQKAPVDYEILKAIVSMYVGQHQPAKAEAQLRKALAADPKQAGTYELLGALALSQNQGEAAVKALEKAIELNPQWLSPYAQLGGYYEKRGEMDKAVAIAREAIEAQPGDWGMHAALANLLEKSRQPEQAERVYRDFIAAHEGQAEAGMARVKLEEFLTRSGRADEGRAVAEAAAAKNPNDRGARLQQARMAIADKKAPEAIAALQSVLKEQPDSADALTLLAAAYQLDGKNEQVRDSLEKAVRAKPADLGVRKNLVQFLVQQKDLPAALAQADDFIKAKPDSLDALNLKADVLVIDKQQEPLEALLKDIEAQFPDHPQAPFRLGTYYQSRGKLNEALAEYEIALQKSRNAYEPLKAMVAAYLELKEPAKAEARLKKVVAENPKHAGAYQLLGSLAIIQNHGEEGVKALNKAIEISPDWLPPYGNLASHYERAGQPERAIAVYQKALAVVPNDAALGLGLARVYEASKQYNKALAQYEAIVKAHPDNLLAVNNLASTLSTAPGHAAELPRALELARRLETTDEPAFLDTLAWIYHLSGDTAKALPIQEKVVARAPQPPVFQYHLGMMYLKQGDSAKARQHLSKALEAKADFAGIEEARVALGNLK